MFELLSNLQTVPIDPDSLTTVYRGMNKVRVSVGGHTSEQSEVYIITGRSEDNLESYIIFYMLEPEIPLVYGYDQNPYDPSREESVIEEAVNFVEEMGSILEEVPWGDMTPQQRSAWIEKEILYSIPAIEDLEEIEDLEPVEMVEVAEKSPEEEAPEGDEVIETGESIIEVSDEEVEQLLSDDTADELLPETESVSDDDFSDTDVQAEQEEEPESISEAEEKGKRDIVVVDGDFDELLKQAFLKPDIASKTRINKEAEEVPEAGDEEPPEAEKGPYHEIEHHPSETSLDDSETELEGEVEVEVQPLLRRGIDIDEDFSEEEEPPITVEDRGEHGDEDLSEEDTRNRVVRYLSRF